MTKTADIAVYCIGLVTAVAMRAGSVFAQVLAHAVVCLRSGPLVGSPQLGIGLLPSVARVREQRGGA
ncbi:MAG: hypothetical protein AAGK71_03945 [Pseudomonadota bacterium]